jgi:N-terminal domain of anti-restriction factor ArdC
MSRPTARAHVGSDRQSLYDEITTKIISQLEAGCVPWVQPWGTAAAKASLAIPKNAATGRCYSGINVLILCWCATTPLRRAPLSSSMKTPPSVLTANHLQALAGRLDRRAGLIESDQPEAAADDRLAARLCRHAVALGWVFTSVTLP